MLTSIKRNVSFGKSAKPTNYESFNIVDEILYDDETNHSSDDSDHVIAEELNIRRIRSTSMPGLPQWPAQRNHMSLVVSLTRSDSAKVGTDEEDTHVVKLSRKMGTYGFTLVQAAHGSDLVVGWIKTQSPSYHAGLRFGDVVKQVNGFHTDDFTPKYATNCITSGPTAVLTIMRNKFIQSNTIVARDGRIGVSISNGMITSIEKDSAAYVTQLTAGYKVVGVNGQTTLRHKHLIKLLRVSLLCDDVIALNTMPSGLFVSIVPKQKLEVQQSRKDVDF
ncbi:hypothetical protein SARC_00365 [Sphaeroforma arctica JP610]|uniref:PDZ domain-containing protein n=1 Tax=Sphaeroforma arctica JP610 TaxID=667725 RepID=A0A0L0GFA3_9EUKA|nr:hypothetical protein SARC_00365 [Sphaeroforma arctica JP610]KNC87541.1 hypothetical protein SARC_00365 [Sphaeroforma arctica JP610]|eukprot:XP_014161443.1 hypothetical protein SARC_00365 [Sphaeroforma arctica JP610]